MYESLYSSLCACFLYKILALSSRAKSNYPQKVTLMNHDIMQQFYPDMYLQRCLLKVQSVRKIMKIKARIIANIAIVGCLSVVSILLIFFWGTFNQGALAPQPFHIRFKISIKSAKDLAPWLYILIQLLVKDVFESSRLIIAP